MPPLIDRSSEEPSPPPSTKGLIPIPHLPSMSLKDRDDYYHTAFHHDIPIEKFAVPAACALYPEYAEEICSAYMEYTTFIFKVWINYDAGASKFFTDNRFQDCGELRLTHQARIHLKRIGADTVLYGTGGVRFDIGTAFRPLAQVTIELRPSKLDVGPAIDTFVADVSGRRHPGLINYLHTICEVIKDDDITDGKDGLVLADIDRLALRFLRMPDEYEERRWGERWYDGIFFGTYEDW
ncbi:hypothetical protein LTR36_008630 [Oleoguttula mirabilis]|uniref:Uncharacterized protein n=1 Tax=Oleoguttula mirabilis TaxID=1507867 RepID=A0AAV9JV46_9PEZI|nr:hypothetical protein LTR36_008630 [Oleoguttula mirabilis]